MRKEEPAKVVAHTTYIANRLTSGKQFRAGETPQGVLTWIMRITGGHAARRILKAPKGLDVRPTPDLVKQAVFNSLGGRVVGARVLELFAGTGALSLEIGRAHV